jgi:hypothetical protein
MWHAARVNGDAGFQAISIENNVILPSPRFDPHPLTEYDFASRRDGRVVEGAPLLREYMVKSCIEGSNPSLSANRCT